ncbi:MAG: choice-of-anchor B family protein [Phycisphaerales bacterium]|nr:choice-of-anchor B family protein [Phycisphaerales bacterium]
MALKAFGAVNRALLVGSALVLGVGAVAMAHSDDPKALDRNGHYMGNGWTAGRGWLGAPAEVLGQQAVERDLGPDGLLGPGFAANNVQLHAWLSPSDLGSPTGEGADCWGYVSGSGREYALITLTNATVFVEVTDPNNPVVIHTDTAVPNSIWHDIKTFGTYAYAVSEGGQGIRVYNLANIDSGVVTRLSDVTTGGVTSSHNIAIDTTSGFIYRCGGSSGLGIRFYDINANPAAPVYVGQWTDRYVHDAQIVTYTSGPYAGKQVAFCCSGFGNGSTDTALSIVDVTNKAAPVVMSITPYSSRAYCHQGWLSEDRQYFYLDDELDEQTFGGTTTTRIMDVSNLNAPVELPSYTNGINSIDHNLYTKNGLAYAANYRSGLRVHDLSNPTAPVEVGFFDTYPEGDGASFNGAWSNYPYLPSGTIIVSDIERGLFVLRYSVPELALWLPSGEKDLVNPFGDQLDIQIDEINGGQFSSGRMYVDTGAGFVSSPLSDLGGGQYRGLFPSSGCGDPVSYYIEADSVGGQTLVLPVGAPTNVYQAISGTGQVNTYLDDVEVDLGWSTSADGTVTSGFWELADPEGTGAQPEDDASPAGSLCWVTGPLAGTSVGSFDIDGGAVTLDSPSMDATSGSGIPFVGYSRWYSNDAGADPNNDSMTVLISNDGGANWALLELVTENLGVWEPKQFRVDDFVTPTGNMVLRFIASDLGAGSVVEAGIDDVRIDFLQCATVIPGDVTGDGCVDLNDLSVVLFNFGANTSTGDTDGNNVVDLADLSNVLFYFGSGC